MPYSAILTSARKITLGRTYLWFFGFLAALVIQETSSTFGSFLGSSTFLFQLGSAYSSLSTLTFILFITGFLMWLWSTAGRICLIHEVANIDMRNSKRTPKSTIRELLPVAKHHMLSIIGLQLLLWGPVILFFNASTLLSMVGLPAGMSDTFGGIFYLIGGLLGLLLIFVDAFAWRALIVDELGISGAIGRGLRVFRSNMRSVLAMTLFCGLIGLAYALIIGLVLLPLMATFLMEPLQATLSSCSNTAGSAVEQFSCMEEFATSPMMIVPMLLLGVLSAAMSALWVAFQSAVFTIVYLQLS